MPLTLTPQRLKRYHDIGRLLMKYGRKDLVHRSIFGDIEEDEPKAAPTNGAALSKPEQLAADLEGMGPTFVKIGQFLSTRTDFLPTDYLVALSRLQDRAQPVPFADIERIVAEELGVRGIL